MALAMHTRDALAYQILQFIATPQATRLARSYHVDPRDAIGELWRRLSFQMSRAKTPIRDLEKWVRINGKYMLKTYLRDEARHRLRQLDDDQ